jgi:hypothetical protein
MSAVTNSPVTPSRNAFHNGDVCFAGGSPRSSADPLRDRLRTVKFEPSRGHFGSACAFCERRPTAATLRAAVSRTGMSRPPAFPRRPRSYVAGC